MGNDIPPRNNLNWLRLIFAVQVVTSHAAGHLGMPLPAAVGHFPGVPAFFLVSGFLIYDAWLRDPGLSYARNRFLRLFPGLLAVTLGALALVLMVRGVGDLAEHPATYGLWFLGQITVLQVYNPTIFSNVGIGELNGSLWTITVEILFYCTVPVIVWLERRWRWTVAALMMLSFAVYMAKPLLEDVSLGGTWSLYGGLMGTPVVWGWMFGFGILARKHFGRVRRALPWAPWALLPMIALAMIGGDGPFLAARGNHLGLLYFGAYAALILWLAFCTPHVRLKNDYSYGAYIWHMPIINLVVALGMPAAAPAAIILTALAAWASWTWIERPALSLKRDRGTAQPLARPPAQIAGIP